MLINVVMCEREKDGVRLTMHMHFKKLVPSENMNTEPL